MCVPRTSACCTNDSDRFKRQYDCSSNSRYHSCTTSSVTKQLPSVRGLLVHDFVDSNQYTHDQNFCTCLLVAMMSPALTWLRHSRKTHVCSSANFGTSSGVFWKSSWITLMDITKLGILPCSYLLHLTSWFWCLHGRFFVALLQRQCAGGAAAHLQDVLVRLNFNEFYNMKTFW